MSQLQDLLATKDGFEKSDAFFKYLRQNAWDKGIPLSGSFELTPRCTLDCKMCYVHLREDQMHQAELSTEQWVQLIDEACGAGMMFATLTGGECLLHPGFKEIYEHLQSRGVLVTIMTNGTLLDEEMTVWLSKRSPRRVQISVYGSSPKGYKAVTGNADAFFKVDRAIDLLKNYGIPFSIAITVSKQMIDDYRSIYWYCTKKEPLRLNLSILLFRARKDTGRDYHDYAPSLDEQVEFYKTRLELEGNSAQPFSPVDDTNKLDNGLDSSIRPVDKGISCHAGRSSFSISWDGKMLACNSFDFAEAFPLIDGFIVSWRYINKRACEYNMPIECFYCEYSKVCIHCSRAHWLGAGEGHCNPDICEEGKRMLSEGIRVM